MKRYHYIIIISIVVLFAFLVYYFMIPVETQEIPVQFAVGSVIGMSGDTDELYFGTVLLEGTSRKEISIENDETRLVRIKVQGVLKELDWVTITDNNFIIQPDETKYVNITISTPREVEYGNYSGKLIIEFYRTIRKV